MKLPREISGEELSALLKKYGYIMTRQTGSRMRLTTTVHGEHHITIPAHDPLKVGTLAAILGDVATHTKIDREELLRRLFG